MLYIRRVVGNSMASTLLHGQLVVAVRWPVRVGSVVILRHNGFEKIKRIQQRKDGAVFVVGDNQAASTDSRTFGWVDESAIMGRLMWPFRPRRPRL